MWQSPLVSVLHVSQSLDWRDSKSGCRNRIKSSNGRRTPNVMENLCMDYELSEWPCQGWNVRWPATFIIAIHWCSMQDDSYQLLWWASYQWESTWTSSTVHKPNQKIQNKICCYLIFPIAYIYALPAECRWVNALHQLVRQHSQLMDVNNQSTVLHHQPQLRKFAEHLKGTDEGFHFCSHLAVIITLIWGFFKLLQAKMIFEIGEKNNQWY